MTALKDHFSKNIEDILNSSVEFYFKPEFYREILRTSPKYFVHYKLGDKHVFGLSKFCAFKDISVEEYISEYRYLTRGDVTQKYISKLVNMKWMPRANVDKQIRKAFDNWISDFFPNYNLDNASFISLKLESVSKTKVKRSKTLSPAEIAKKLQLQEEIGKVGELIAMEYEIKRLKEMGIKKPQDYVEHISLKIVNSGYDIYSATKDDTRFIEVKSSVNMNEEFYISSNEIETLTDLGSRGYIYFVHVTDLENEKGKVYKVCKNPFGKHNSSNWHLKPIIFKVRQLNAC